MKMPMAMTMRSPTALIIRPQNGLEASRISAKAEITAPTSKLPTPKLRAKTGSTGTRTPKPTATQKAIRPRTYTSRGKRLIPAQPLPNRCRPGHRASVPGQVEAVGYGRQRRGRGRGSRSGLRQQDARRARPPGRAERRIGRARVPDAGTPTPHSAPAARRSQLRAGGGHRHHDDQRVRPGGALRHPDRRRLGLAGHRHRRPALRPAVDLRATCPRSPSRSPWRSCWPRCSPRSRTGCAAGGCPPGRPPRSPCSAGSS